MKLGQIPENVYDRSVIKQIQYKNENVKGGTGSGGTCAFFVTDNVIASSDNKNASLKELNGSLAIYSAVNALVANYCEPEAVNINMLMPHRFAEEKLKLIITELENVAESLGVQIATFNGEMLNELMSPVLSVNAIGSIEKEMFNMHSQQKPQKNQEIVLTKWVGMAGAVIIAENKYDELTARFSASYIDGAIDLKNHLSIKKEAGIIKRIAKEAALAGKSAIIGLAVSKGGIYKALWDMAKLGGTGLEVNLKNIPIKQETVEICNYYDLNPYELYSEGCMLIACDNGSEIVDELEKADIPAFVIGRLTSDNDRVIINDTERKFLTKPCPDEMTKVIL